jgi:MinD superfamily P-loop ATPase
VIIAVASGKGGTGKTTVATSLALTLALDSPVLFLDCDVEAPNAHLLLKPSFTRRKDAALLLPAIDESRCDQCGTCAEVCQYHALAVTGQRVLVFPEMCHGCGSCALNCGQKAIREVPHSLGTLERGNTLEGIQFARGTLHVGQSWTIPIIRQLKDWLPVRSNETVIIDAPPGTSCPVAESVRNADYVLLVTEPTPFGLHDLKLAYELVRELGLPAAVIINRDGIGDQGVDDFCTQAGLPVLLRIPMDREIAAGIAQGIPLVTLKPEYRPLFEQLFLAAAGVRA